MLTEATLLCQGLQLRNKMSEKKFVLNDLRISYNGPIEVNDFMEEINKWFSEMGYEKEPKKYSERFSKGAKKIEWVVESHKILSRLYESTIRVRGLFNNLKESTSKKDGRKTRIVSGEVLIYIDGIVESHVQESYYHSKPVYQFIVGIIDKYIYTFWGDKYDGVVSGDGHKLFKKIRAYLSLQKYKYQNRS